MNTLYMIGNTHFDPAWLWTWDEAMASIRSTFRSALDRMKEDPDFVYSFCTPAVFEWIRKTDPDMFEEIRDRAAAGQWDVGAEGWWLQPDCNAPSGESLIRQGLYGQRYLQKYFGRTATVVFNADSFGHSAMIPQIMQKSGLKYYVLTRPCDKERELESDLFVWQSPDGSKVLAFRPGSQSEGFSWASDTGQSIEIARKQALELDQDRMVVYGVSNHGGAPTKKSLADIHEAQSKYEDIAVRFGSAEDFFAAQEGKCLPRVDGELQSDYYGPFSDHGEVKRDNRRAETAVLNAEKAACISSILSDRSYPQEVITHCWEDVMFNQFHDILGGTSILEVFEDARNLHGRVLQTAKEIQQFSLQAICRKICTFGDNESSVWNLCLFNLTGAAYCGEVEAEVQWAWEFPWYADSLELVDETGGVHPVQIIAEKSAIPGFRSRMVFRAEVPAMGYRTYAVRKTYMPTANKVKQSQLQSPFVFRVYEDAGDVWCFNTTEGYGAACEEPILTERTVAECGEIRETVRQKWQFRQSTLEEWITYYYENDEIAYHFQVNWNEKQKVLKLQPVDRAETDHIRVSIPCGSVLRQADGKEYPVNGWMCWDGNDTEKGKTLLLDGVTAYDTADGLRLTVLRSPVVGDLRIAPLDENIPYQYMEQGVHGGRIRILPDKLKNSDAESRFQQWSNPPIVICEANHQGTLPPTWQGIAGGSEGAVIIAMKQAEDGSGMILRMAEYDGKQTKGCVEVCSGKEERVGFEAELKPYEIKTYVIQKGSVTETDLLERPL